MPTAHPQVKGIASVIPLLLSIIRLQSAVVRGFGIFLPIHAVSTDDAVRTNEMRGDSPDLHRKCPDLVGAKERAGL